MKELSIEEMASLRGGKAAGPVGLLFGSFNGLGQVVSLGNVSAPTQINIAVLTSGVQQSNTSSSAAGNQFGIML